MTVISLPQPTPTLVVFGRDTAGKPHASWFDQASAELATKAARLMNMHAVPVESGPLRELVDTLPRGRVFSSGRAFTPFIKRQLYDRLVELTRDLLGLAAESLPEGGGTNGSASGASGGSGMDTDQAGSAPGGNDNERTGVAKRPTSPEQIGVGSVVLAGTGPAEGWFEAEVIGLNGGMLTLKYQDYPAERTFVRRRDQLGLLPATA